MPDCIIAKQSASVKRRKQLYDPVISGKLVLSDETNRLKAAIFIKGLVKKTTKFRTVYEAYRPNSRSQHQLIEGTIYKAKEWVQSDAKK